MLDLTKGQTLDLNKESGKTLTKVRIGAGWDVADGKTVDLDLWLAPKGGAPAYFNNKNIPGVALDGDDTTGAGSADGADENMHIDIAGLANDEYTVFINIYDAVNKGQFFKDVKRAFVEIVDEETGTKIGQYNMSTDGGDNSALVAGRLVKTPTGLTFTAVGEYSTKDAVTVCKEAGANV